MANRSIKEESYYKNFQKYLNEDETDDKVQQILGASYPEFVKQLGDNIKDPKFVAAIEKLADTNPIKTSQIAPAVKDLIPTQNEISADKSLNYPLTDPSSAETFLKGGTVAPGGKRIVTSGGGKYIIDGHHRWSQVFVINPECKIESVDIANIPDPVDALKATQIGIAVNLKTLPSGKAGGVDMLKSGENEIKKYVKSKVTKEVMKVFVKYGKVKVNSNRDADNLSESNLNQLATYIWNNVNLMQTKNKPADDAPPRTLMPQTDDAKNWPQEAPAVESIQKRLDNYLKESIIKLSK